MKKYLLSVLFAAGVVVGVEAAPTDAVTQADLQALIQRINKLEAENQAQAKKIRELEARDGAIAKQAEAAEMKATKASKDFELQTTKLSKMSTAMAKVEEGTTTNETGRIYTTSNGKKYYLADAFAGIFEPLSESGLQITPYGYLVFEGVYSTRPLDCDWSTDFVMPMGKANNTTLSMQDSIMGIHFMTPEADHGWKFSGKAEFDLAGSNQNQYDFHWRHLYINAEHESGWSILFGQTWHLWKMVTPSEIDGAWMENAGHPYRRSPQLRVTKTFDWEDSSLELRAGIVKGGPGMGGDRDSDWIEDNSSSPWVLIEGAAIYDRKAAWQEDDRRWLVGLGGQWGRDKSHRLSPIYGFGGDEDEYDSMMGMIAASIPFGKFTLCGQFFAGQNLGGIQAGAGQRVIYHPVGDEFVKGNAVRTMGGFVDLSYQITDDWSAAIGYGCDDPLDSDVEGGTAGNSGMEGILFNDRLYVAAFYQVTGNFKLGLEYARLMTSYADSNTYGGIGGDYDADRIQFSAFYDF